MELTISILFQQLNLTTRLCHRQHKSLTKIFSFSPTTADEFIIEVEWNDTDLNTSHQRNACSSKVSEINSSNFWCFLNAHKIHEALVSRHSAPYSLRAYEKLFKLNFMLFLLYIYLFDLIVDSISTLFFLLQLERLHEIINQFKSEWECRLNSKRGGIAY